MTSLGSSGKACPPPAPHPAGVRPSLSCFSILSGCVQTRAGRILIMADIRQQGFSILVQARGHLGASLTQTKLGKALDGGWLDSEILKWFLSREDVDSKDLCRQDG